MLSYKHVVSAILVAFTLACSSGPSGGRRYDGPGPVELQGHFTAKSGTSADLEKTFHEVYYPAISSQAGFKYSNLLTVPNSSGKYVLTLAFESEDPANSVGSDGLASRSVAPDDRPDERRCPQ